MPSNLFERIKETVGRFKAQLPGYKPAIERSTEAHPEAVEDATHKYVEGQLGYVDQANLINAIIQAGAERRLLYIRYNGRWRYVEPYMLEQKPKGPMLWGWCLTDNTIKSFYVYKIQEMHMTDVPFVVRTAAFMGRGTNLIR